MSFITTYQEGAFSANTYEGTVYHVGISKGTANRFTTSLSFDASKKWTGENKK